MWRGKERGVIYEGPLCEKSSNTCVTQRLKRQQGSALSFSPLRPLARQRADPILSHFDEDGRMAICHLGSPSFLPSPPSLPPCFRASDLTLTEDSRQRRRPNWPPFWRKSYFIAAVVCCLVPFDIRPNCRRVRVSEHVK